jgi:hypothetical protein
MKAATRAGLTPAGDNELMSDQVNPNNHLQLPGTLRVGRTERPSRRPAGAGTRRLVLVRTSSVVQHRRRGCSRRRSGSRRGKAARPAVGCSFAPGAVTSAARIASLHHAWTGSQPDGSMAAALLAEQNTAASCIELLRFLRWGSAVHQLPARVRGRALYGTHNSVGWRRSGPDGGRDA